MLRSTTNCPRQFQMNLQALRDDLVAAINQMYLMDDHMPYSNYRVGLVNRLGTYVHHIDRTLKSKAAKADAAKIQPDLPWD